jgi:hypothetical protein
MRVLCFNTSDILSEIKIDKNDDIVEIINISDKRPIKILYIWTHDNITLECYGCDVNDSNENINTHCLPPNENIHTLYGNIYIVSKINNHITDLDISQYGMLSYYIQEKFDNISGCDYLDDTDTDEEMDDDSTCETNVSKNIPHPKKFHKKQEQVKDLEELEYDETKY